MISKQKDFLPWLLYPGVKDWVLLASFVLHVWKSLTSQSCTSPTALSMKYERAVPGQTPEPLFFFCYFNYRLLCHTMELFCWINSKNIRDPSLKFIFEWLFAPPPYCCNNKEVGIYNITNTTTIDYIGGLLALSTKSRWTHDTIGTHT